MADYPFADLPLPAARAAGKPRANGLTMSVDFGHSAGFWADHLEAVGDYLDFAKIAVGTARLYREAHLREKMAVFDRHAVHSFIGGQFLEYVFAHRGWDGIAGYFAEARRLGIKAVEVSDNCVPLSDAERDRMIRMGVDAGLEIHGEVGSKDAESAVGDLMRQARICFSAGCDMVLVEGADINRGGTLDPEFVAAVKSELDVDKVMFELPGYWIRGVTANDVFEMLKFLIEAFGPTVNIANVLPDLIMTVETLRTGLGVKGPAGRYFEGEPG